MIKRLGLLLMALAAVSLVGCAGASAPPVAAPPSAAAPTAPEQNVPGASGKAVVVEIGQPATSGAWTLTVSDAQRAAQAGGAVAQSGQELLVLTFDLKNGGTKDEGTGPTSFKLTGPDGTEYQASPTGDPEFIFNTPQPIKAGETRTIKIAYGVPTGTSPLQWVFAPFVEGGQAEPAAVNIK
jgi:hypothetical protein